MRWDIIEKFEVLKKGQYSKAFKSFSGNEDFFREHFPGNPLVPEPLFIEMIAQAGGVLFGYSIDFKKEIILAKITNARFLKEVSPPCEFSIEAYLEEEREEGAWISGTVKVGEELVAEAQIILMSIDFFQNSKKENVVFNENFLTHFDIYNVAKASEVLR